MAEAKRPAVVAKPQFLAEPDGTGGFVVSVAGVTTVYFADQMNVIIDRFRDYLADPYQQPAVKPRRK